MRLFIGLWPDQQAVQELSGWAHLAQAQCGGRLMQPRDMHLTLAFLGQASPEQAQALVQKAPAWPLAVQPLLLTRFAVFQRARIAWAGPAEDDVVTWLHTLYDTLWAELQILGWQPPERFFTPHISLLRSITSTDVGMLQPPPVLCHFTHCQLVASRPVPGQTNYQVLAQLPIL